MIRWINWITGVHKTEKPTPIDKVQVETDLINEFLLNDVSGSEFKSTQVSLAALRDICKEHGYITTENPHPLEPYRFTVIGIKNSGLDELLLWYNFSQATYELLISKNIFTDLEHPLRFC